MPGGVFPPYYGRSSSPRSRWGCLFHQLRLLSLSFRSFFHARVCLNPFAIVMIAWVFTAKRTRSALASFLLRSLCFFLPGSNDFRGDVLQKYYSLSGLLYRNAASLLSWSMGQGGLLNDFWRIT